MAFGLSFVLFLMALGLSLYLYPREHSVKQSQQFEDEAKTTITEIAIDGDWLHPKTYWIYANDQITSITLNNVEIKAALWNSSFAVSGVYNLRPILKDGTNILRVVKVDVRGKRSVFYLYPSIESTFSLVAGLLIASAASSVWACYLHQFLFLSSTDAALFSLGAFIRIIYGVAIPYFVRTHDLHGHLTYINYLVIHHVLPTTHHSWESFQPPLYYVISAIVARVADAVSQTPIFVSFILQIQSCLVSILIMGMCLSISKQLFEESENRHRILFCLICATFPSLIFASNEINNDVLFNLVAVLFMSHILHFWSQPNPRKWLQIMLLLGVGMLIKTSTAALLIASYVCLFFSRAITWRSKCICAVGGCVVVILICGWFHLPNWINSKNDATFVVGNVDDLSEKQKFLPTFSKVVTFNPFKVFSSPFNDRFNLHSRRDIFWEYYFKSAFFGQWDYSRDFLVLAKCLVAAAIALIPALLAGFIVTVIHFGHRAWPLAVLPAVIVLCQVAWLWSAPYTSSEDFRYFPILSLPFAYFILEGAKMCPNILAHAIRLLLLFVCVSCFCFVAILCLAQT